MSRTLAIRPAGPLSGEVPAPASKSVTNRALLLAALSPGRSRLRGILLADDTRHMMGALERLGFALRREGQDVEVDGGGGSIPAPAAQLEVGNAGTAMRFLTAAAALGPGPYRLDGEPRMRQRPIGELAAALTALGAAVAFPGEEGFPPLEVRGGRLHGGTVSLPAARSSQFASALLMIAPCLPGGLELRLEGEIVSAPYLEITLDLMARFGGDAERLGADRFLVPGGGYRGADLPIEGDASAAAALLAAAAVTGGRVRVSGLPLGSRQPDLRFAELLETMGCRVTRDPEGVTVEGRPRSGIDVDLREAPDLAPALAAVALFAGSPSRIRGAAHLRLKESNRIEDLARGLRRVGGRVREHEDGLSIEPRPLAGARLDPCRDHRLAMAFTVVGLRVPGVEILDPDCVAKSYPDFFDALERLRPEG